MTHNDRHPEVIADCRLRGALDLFTHTWDAVVLAALHEGPRRRADLRARIGGISDKALTEALRRLLGRGLVTRDPRAGSPPRVEYALTPLGTTLVAGPLTALAAWVRGYGDELPVPEGTAVPLRRSGRLPGGAAAPSGGSGAQRTAAGSPALSPT